jgi:hypothetical protein
MFIAILASKLGLDNYKAIHAASIYFWNIIAEETDLKPISEQQLRRRLKKFNYLVIYNAEVITA